jgi:GT2 family glycosyltransferase
MHNSAATVIKTLDYALFACDQNGYQHWVFILDDFSAPDQVAQVREHIDGRSNVMLVSVAEQFPEIERNPNLGLILNACLNQVALDVDYYLNLESDVYINEYTIPKLIESIERTGAPAACPIQFTPGREGYDFIFWGAGIIELNRLPDIFKTEQRPKWCNIGCLLIRGDVARDRRVRSDHEQFKLWCVDQDFVCQMAQLYGRPVYNPEASVVHVGRQSTRENYPDGYGWLVPEAVQRCDTKWADYIRGGLFAQ